VFRWRAPLWLAQVDVATLRLVRATERVVLPLVGDGVRDPGMGRKQRLAPGREQREGKQKRAPFARPQRAQEARRRCGPGNHRDVMYPARPQVNATGRWFWHKPARGAGAAPDIPQRSTDT
jgi:hypothetical protein